MSNADFQDRLRRIGANSAHCNDTADDKPRSSKKGAQKIHHGFMALGAASMAIGIQMLKHANQNYETLRDSGSVGLLAGLVVGGFAVLVVGIAVMLRAISQKADANAFDSAPEFVRQPSTGARVFFSLLGSAFGAIAVFYMFMAGAARTIDTERAVLIANGGFLIAVILVLVSLMFGFTGLFLRGYALGRVPAYFLLGGVLTYAAVRIARINMLEWPQLMAVMQ